MKRDRPHSKPEIIGRLRNEAEERLDEPAAPRWARPVGWLIVVGIVAVILVMILRANPL